MKFITFSIFLIGIHFEVFSNTTDPWTVEKCEQKLDEWYPEGSRVDRDVWKKAVTTFFSKANNSNFKCLLGVVDQKRPSTARMWVGTFNSQGPQQVMEIDAATGDSSHEFSDGYHSNSPTFSDFIGQCGRGSTPLNNTGNGTYTYRTTNGVTQEVPTRVVELNAEEMGIDPSLVNTTITYRSVITGLRYLHDGLQCENELRQGRNLETHNCTPTWGCITIYSRAMRELCENYLGDPEISGNEGSTGGMFLFSKMESLPRHVGCNQALRGLEKLERGEICTDIPLVTIAPSSRDRSESGPPSAERRIASNRESAGRSANIFEAIGNFFRSLFMGETNQT